MNRILRVFNSIFVFVFLISSLACFPLFECENTVEKESVSPDGKLKAVIFDRGCGATTGFSTHISIISANSKLPDAAGNIFSADEIYRDFSTDKDGKRHEGKINFDVAWTGSAELTIFYRQPDKDILFKRENFENVSIRYEALPQ